MTATDDLKKAIALVEQAANILQKSQMAFDFTVSNPHAHDHHVAYTRTNASGTVSNIAAKGVQTQKIQGTMEEWKRHLPEDMTSKQAAKQKVWGGTDSADGKFKFRDWETGDEVPNYEGEYTFFSKDGGKSQMHTWMDEKTGERAHSALTKEEWHKKFGQAEKHQAMIDGVHKVGNDLLQNPMMAAHHDNIRRKLEGLKTNPTAKYAAQVAGDLKLMAEKAKKKTEKPLPTNNEGYGYHGEAYTAHEGHVKEQEQGAGADTHFAEAAKHVMKYGGVGAEDARNYLDSRYGRNLHDEVHNFTSQHEGRPKDVEKGHHPDTIKKYIGPAIKEHFQHKYAKKALAEVVKDREYFK